nr:hypothetical protein [Morchella crassipes]
MEAPVGASKGAGGVGDGGGEEGGNRQRPRLSSTDERCIPSYRGDGESCAAPSPPLDLFSLALAAEAQKTSGRGGSQQLLLRGGLPACFASGGAAPGRRGGVGKGER